VLDETKRREIYAILSVGGSRAAAARYVGCHAQTIRNTAQRDPQFGAALERAESSDEIVLLTNITKAGKDPRYWRAAAWALERKYPDRYGQRDPKAFTAEQISTILGHFSEVIIEEIPDEADARRILERLNGLIAEFGEAAQKGGTT
jgi:hypothetical protein